MGANDGDGGALLVLVLVLVQMSLLMLVYGLGVLVPVNVYGAPLGMTEFERYSMSNVQHGSALLWAHWVGAHLFSLLFMHALYKEYQVVGV